MIFRYALFFLCLRCSLKYMVFEIDLTCKNKSCWRPLAIICWKHFPFKDVLFILEHTYNVCIKFVWRWTWDIRFIFVWYSFYISLIFFWYSFDTRLTFIIYSIDILILISLSTLQHHMTYSNTELGGILVNRSFPCMIDHGCLLLRASSVSPKRQNTWQN